MNALILMGTSAMSVVFLDSVFFCFLKREEMPIWKLLLAAVFIAALIFSMNMIEIHYNLVFAVSLFLTLAYGSVFYHGHRITKIFATLLIGTITVTGDHLGVGVFLLIHPGIGFEEMMGTSIFYWIVMGAANSYFAITATLFYMFPLAFDIIPNRKSITLLSIPLIVGIMIFLTNTLWIEMSIVNGWAYLLPFFTFVLLLVLTILFYRTAERTEQRERELNTLNMQLRHFGESYETIIGDLENIHAFQHDIHQHMNTLGNLAEQGHLAAITKYLEDIAPGLIIVRDSKITPNVVVDMLIRQKKALAERDEIRFILDVSVPQELGIAYPDLCVILSNALDNAIEASRREGDKAKRYIKVKIFLRKPCLFVFIINNIAEQPLFMHGQFVSTKEKRNEHGYGLKNIQTLVKKYGGGFLPEWHDDRFVFNCSIPLPTQIWEAIDDDSKASQSNSELLG